MLVSFKQASFAGTFSVVKYNFRSWEATISFSFTFLKRWPLNLRALRLPAEFFDKSWWTSTQTER